MRHAAKVNGVRFARANEAVSPRPTHRNQCATGDEAASIRKFLISMDLARVSRGAFAGLLALRGDAMSGSPA
jgi:hypothetical protein